MDKRTLIGLTTTAIMLLSLLASMLYVIPAVSQEEGQDPAEWYLTVPGVLDSDYYVLYPYEKNSLTIGISKFGELIDANTKTGLLYDGVDAFASDPYVPEFEWSQGWVINITYAYSGTFRNVWAFALYSDSYSPDGIGGDWKRAPAADSVTVLGGRKYGGYSADGEEIGYVETAPLKVLYNSSRLFVALSSTTIYEDTAKNFPLVRVDLTFIFEKVKKYVIVLKDIKRLDFRKFSSYFQVEFSNRGEWDLGTVQSPRSYAHFFDDLLTCYHEGWHPYYPNNAYYDVAQIISSDTPGYVGFAAFWPSLISKYVEGTTYMTRKRILTTMETYIAKFSGNGTTTEFAIEFPDPEPVPYPRGDGVWSDEPMVFVNGKLQAPAGRELPGALVDYPYIWDSENDVVIFTRAPPEGEDNIWLVYKRYVHKTDMSVEPAVPYVIAEWDFDLPNEPDTQFRGVTVYGIVNYHDADDIDAGDLDGNGVVEDKLDREVQYQLDEVFNPWSLLDAVEKQTTRWVEFFTGDGDTWEFVLSNTPLVSDSSGRMAGAQPAWDEYCSFAERILVDGELIYPIDALIWDGSEWTWWPSFPYTYQIFEDGTIVFLKDDDEDTGTIDFVEWAPSEDSEIKVLYSTWRIISVTGAGGLIQLGLCLDDSGSISSDDWDLITEGVASAIETSLPHDGSVELTVVQFSDTARVAIPPTVITDANYQTIADTVRGLTQQGGMTAMAAGLNATWQAMKNSPNFAIATKQVINVATDGIPNVPLNTTASTGDAEADVVLVRDTAAGEGLDEIDAEAIGAGADVLWIRDNLVWPQPGHIAPPYIPGWVEQVPDAEAFADAVSTKFMRLFQAKGRYEWVVVGRDAATVDSAGAALVSAAFKNKGVEIGLAGADMDAVTVANAMPWVMGKFGEGNSWADYLDDIGRAALRDDWCHTWPVSSSNMIGVGGPLANLLAYYGNDFTSAFFGLSQYAAEEWAGSIIALSCWSKNTYASDESTGYAVIATYKDLNGTVLFLIWGHWGRDTYYATKWFHEEGIYQLQEAPDCATSLILEIDYTEHEPEVSVVEVLGTISELEEGVWHEGKGGIHTDP